jgi:hypothetical protein
MKLIEKQKLFPLLLAQFYLDLKKRGYEFTLGESYRPPETAKLYQLEGRGIATSNHCIKIAQDLNLFKNGFFLSKLEQYQEAGNLWESYSTNEYQCCWGGEWGDADHFSLEHNGVR